EPAAGSSPRERQSLLRAFATLAATPTTRLAVDVPPPRIDVQPGASLVLTATGPTRKLHLEAEGCGPPVPEPAGCTSAGCGACVRTTPAPRARGGRAPASRAPPPPREPRGCALPNGDVILRIGPRLFTTRADDRGWWSLD